MASKLGIETPGHTQDGCERCLKYDRERAKLRAKANPAARRAIVQRYREKHREAYNARYRIHNARRRDDKKEFVREVVGSVCVDCGEDRPAAIEYHHPNGRESAKSPENLSWKSLKDDVMSLVALCGTCHNLRHRGVAV